MVHCDVVGNNSDWRTVFFMVGAEGFLCQPSLASLGVLLCVGNVH